jgi:hypothetical protein
MKSKQLTILLFFCLIFISLSTLAKKDELKLWLVKGQSFTYLISQENTLQERVNQPLITQKMSLKINHTVVDRLPNGNYQMQAFIKSFGTEFDKFGKKYRYHSDTVDVRNKLYKTLNFLTDVKLSYELSPEGVVSKLTGFQMIKDKMEQDPQLNSILRAFGNEQYLMEFFHYVPFKEVETGSKWSKPAILPELMNHKYEIQYSFKEQSEKEIKLSHDASFTFKTQVPVNDTIVNYISENGTQKGFITIDPKTRMPISSDITQKIEISTYKNKPSANKVDPALLTTETKMIRVKK